MFMVYPYSAMIMDLLLANEIRIINRNLRYKIPSAYDDKATIQNTNIYIGLQKSGKLAWGDITIRPSYSGHGMMIICRAHQLGQAKVCQIGLML